MFQDALRLAHRVQQLVILTATVVSLFALSAVPVEDLYVRARTQIETAISIEWSDYDRWVKERLVPAKESRELELQKRETFQIYSANDGDLPIEEAWKRIEPNIITRIMRNSIPNYEALIELQVALDVSTIIETKWNDTPTHFASLDTTTPLDMLRYVKSARANQDALLISVSVEEAERVLWRTITETVLHVDRYSKTNLASEVRCKATADGVTSGEDDDIPMGQLYITIKGEWLARDVVKQPPYYEGIGRDESLEKKYVLDRREVPNTSIVTWLSVQYPDLGQINSDGKLVPFSGLEHVWREIADRPLTDADLYLSALAAEEKRRGVSVSMLGLTIPAPLVPIAGPLVIMLLLLHLSRLIAHIQHRASEHREELREYAWLVLHSNRGWWSDPLISLMLLPLLMQIFITLKLSYAEPIWINAGWLMTCFALLIAVRVWRQLSELRSVASSEGKA